MVRVARVERGASSAPAAFSWRCRNQSTGRCVWMSMRRAGSVLLLIAITAACSSGHRSVTPPTSSTTIDPQSLSRLCGHEGVVVIGTLRMVGGPPGAKPVGVAGLVIAERITKRHLDPASTMRCRAPAAHDGTFALSLESGTYDVRGRSPSFERGTADCLADKRVVIPLYGPHGSPRPFTVNVDCPRR